jgi:uncharacterized protein YjeT (DUF2065 family)
MRFAYVVIYIGDPLAVVFGLLMFRYPQTWAKLNARLSRKEIHEFDSPKQLASTRRLGALLMAFAVFSIFAITRLVLK